MLPAAFVKGNDGSRLRLLLGALFIALAIPTGVVVWQAYDQLKWESWYQYRGQAESLARRIDAELAESAAAAEARSFTDYSFLNVATSGNVLSRSPLSVLPVPGDVPGVIGYFQVDPNGEFSTPLLPVSGDPVASGLSQDEIIIRSRLEARIRNILTGNQLLRDGAASGGRLQADRESDAASYQTIRTAPVVPAENRPAPASVAVEEQAIVAPMRAPTEAEPEETSAPDAYTQQMFDRLSQNAESVSLPPPGVDSLDTTAAGEPADALGKIRDMRLDDELQRKNEDLARQEGGFLEEAREIPATEQLRSRRVEKSILPAAPAELADEDTGDNAGVITAFESEVDPYQFSLLDTGHLVLFRNVWRNGSRYIQGLLIDQSEFSSAVIESAFRSTTLFAMSDLVVGYQGDVIRVIRGGNYSSLPTSASELDGSLLYSGSLSAPFDSLELVFSINHLPPGPGAQVLAWSVLIIAIVFVGGFLALYRLGLGQIRLARQQQDFVSAVSHELKTPLTSIRMYGEMLKEGWADEEKQKQYYEFIHDESERLTRLISNVLQLSRITRSEPQFDARRIKVGTLIDQVRSKISSQVERAGFELDFDISADTTDLFIDVDDDCFAQIVINLVDNAIKFSRNAESKRIAIACHSNADDQVVISVRDHGPGIDKGQLKKIFRLFYRTESELTRETVGTGIGLAIVHQLVTAMGGTVDVVNRDPGAEFRLAFPSC